MTNSYFNVILPSFHKTLKEEEEKDGRQESTAFPDDESFHLLLFISVIMIT